MDTRNYYVSKRPLDYPFVSEVYRRSGQWDSLVKFCMDHQVHGELELQQNDDSCYMACVPCGRAHYCGSEVPRPLLDELVRRFPFSVWLSS